MVGVRVRRWVATRLFPNDVQHDFSGMRTYSVFEEVDAFPGTEYGLPLITDIDSWTWVRILPSLATSS